MSKYKRKTEVNLPEKLCIKCSRLFKPSWYNNSVCTVCRKKKDLETYRGYMKEWRKDKPMYNKSIQRKSRYGITDKEHKELLDFQQGKCAICGVHGDKKKLGIDHDHNTNEVRGLLCRACNSGIGHFKDDSDLLRKAASYLDLFF